MAKLSPRVQESICEGIRLGMTHDLACRYAGVSRRTFYRWMKRGKAGEPEYAEFAAAVDHAEADGAAHHLANIARAASDGTWVASAWILERRHGYTRDGGAATSDEPEEAETETPDQWLDRVSPRKMIEALERAGYEVQAQHTAVANVPRDTE